MVIPSRDRPDRVRTAVASVLAQDDPPAEVIVVDDGSRVPIAPLEGTRVIRHARSLGVASARNAGILAARSDWVALLDDDDLWAPEKLRLQLSAATVRGASWVFASALLVDDAGSVQGTHEAPPTTELRRALRRANVIPAGSSNVVVRRDVLLAAGLFDGELHHFADWDLWMRLAAISTPATVGTPLVGYVRHGASMQITQVRTARRELAALARKHGSSRRDPIGGPWVDLWLAEGLASGGHRVRAATLVTRSALMHHDSQQLRRTRPFIKNAIMRRAPTAAPTRPGPAWANPSRGALDRRDH